MRQDWYRKVICKLCGSAGIPDWERIAEIKQIDVSGYPVALFPDKEDDPVLGIYVEVFKDAGKDNLKIYRLLLEWNIKVSSRGEGFFSLVPQQGIVAYRTSIANADQLSGEDLMVRILDIVQAATANFRSVLSDIGRKSRSTAAKRNRSHFEGHLRKSIGVEK